MIENAPGIERLRRAFSTYEGPGATEPIGDVPIDAERIYLAAAGELPEEERRAVIDQVATNAEAAEVWRLAVELQRLEAKSALEPMEEDERQAERAPGPLPPAEVLPFRRPAPAAPSRRRLYSALAALLAATIGLGLWMQMHAPAPTLRGGESALSATVADGSRLPREAFRLSWKAAPGSRVRYTVRVTTEALDPVATGRDLERTTYQVPAAALAEFPAGTRLLWQVESRNDEGATASSPTYSVEISP